MILDGKVGDEIARLVFWSGFRGFEPETTRIFYNLAKKSNIVFDVGANIGYYSLLAAISNKEARVFAFEPVARIYEYLNHNIELNRLSNVITSCSAVTNFDGEITLYIPAGDIPSSASTLEGFREAEEELKVPAITLDTFVNENNIGGVDLIKIDTEGTEHRVIQGGKNTIRRDEPMIICEVLRGRNEKFLQEFLSAVGYNYYWITGRGLIQKDTIEGDGTYKYLDYLFCKEEKLNSISKYLK
jgi:FkbM family methyltransferase